MLSDDLPPPSYVRFLPEVPLTMTLEDDILQRSREIKTDGYSMSIGEVLSMYRDSELEVHPEFQRIFRWTDDQKSRLIESILLGIPIPTIFVAQREDGIWDVIDGVQRLSTILQFAGVHRQDDGSLSEPLQLRATEYLPSLEGHTYDQDAGKGAVFSETLRRDFKRSKLDFRIIKKESDPDSKYDLFQRLNSGTQLSAQEARNCLLVMLSTEFFHWMTRLAEYPSFLSTVLLSDRKEDEGFRQELVLRFLIHQDFDLGSAELRSELGDFITEWVRKASQVDQKRLDAWEGSFKTTFDLLATSLNENAFRRYDATKSRFLGPFSISAFEAVTSGVGRHVSSWNAHLAASPNDLDVRVQAMWANADFRENSGGGISPRRRAPRLINFGRTFFDRP